MEHCGIWIHSVICELDLLLATVSPSARTTGTYQRKYIFFEKRFLDKKYMENTLHATFHVKVYGALKEYMAYVNFSKK